MIDWNLKEVMERRGVSNQELADTLGVDRRVTSRWRADGFVPQKLNIKYLGAICKLLRCTPNDLLWTKPPRKS